MDDQTKCEIYTKLLNSINKKGALNEEIDEASYASQMKLIKTDLLSPVSGNQRAALELLEILIESNVQGIQTDVVKILKDDSVDLKLKTSILNSLRNYIKELVGASNIQDLSALYITWKEYNVNKFNELLETACSQLSSNTGCKKLLIELLFPMIMSPLDTPDEIRQSVLNIASKFSEIFPIIKLNPEECKLFLQNIPCFLTNIANLKNSNQNAWKEVLQFLIKYLDKELYDSEIQELFKSSSELWKTVEEELQSNLKTGLIKCISQNELVELLNLYKSTDHELFSETVKDVCHNSAFVFNCKKFFLVYLIPAIMQTNDAKSSLKNPLIDMSFEFVSALPITKWSDEECNRFLNNVNDYIKNISELRDHNFESWHKLWMFLVRLLGKKLHHSMSLINRLLRVVEHAFRNSTHEQRLRGYDCWKELIDNVSLDAHHLSSDKQIRLLLTPLRAKFSKQEAVITKRFEVFVYLIEKLQDKGVLVLKEFLEFCFGEVGENTDPNKAGQGKSLPELWIRSAKVLLAIIGHSHEKTEHCLDTDSEIKLENPILDSNNISAYYCHVTNSVAESCILLKDVELNHRHTVIKCFWMSLLNMILKPNVEKRQDCIEAIDKVFEKMLKDDDPHCNSIASTLFKCITTFDREDIYELLSMNLNYILTIIFSLPLGIDSYKAVEKFQITICNADNEETKTQVNHHIFKSFSKFKTNENNADLVAQFWIHLASELDQYHKGKSLDFFLWPAFHLHNLKMRQVLVFENYKEIVAKFIEKTEEMHLALLKNFERILKNNPLLSKNIITLLTMFVPKVENKEILNVTLDILALMLVIPFTDDSKNQLQSIELLLKKIYDQRISLGKIDDQDTIKKLCTCLQHLLKFKQYDILLAVDEVLKDLPDNIKFQHAKFLSLDFLMDLFDKEPDIKITKKIHKVIDTLRNVKNPESKMETKTFMPVGGRSAKIVSLVKSAPRSPRKPGSPSALRLFGKDVETFSPLKVKGSQLKSTPPKPAKASNTTQRKSPKKSAIDDESNSKFVLINTEVKIQPDKLTEHQKETRKKRREDIPALYQDLSQSVSQSLDGSPATVKNKDFREIFKKPENNTIKEEVKPRNQDKVKEVASKEAIECNIQNKNVTEFNLDCSNSAIGDLISDVGNNARNIEIEYIVENGLADPNEDSQGADLFHDTGEPGDAHIKDTKKKAKIKAELKKLSMNIVGADEFLSASSKRKRKDQKGVGAILKDKKSAKNRPLSLKRKSLADEKNAKHSLLENVDGNLKPFGIGPASPNNTPKFDVYNFDKEEAMIIADESVSLGFNDAHKKTPPHSKKTPRNKSSKEKCLKEDPEEKSIIRKSKRKSLPTEKLTQSELFKQTEIMENCEDSSDNKNNVNGEINVVQKLFVTKVMTPTTAKKRGRPSKTQSIINSNVKEVTQEMPEEEKMVLKIQLKNKDRLVAESLLMAKEPKNIKENNQAPEANLRKSKKRKHSSIDDDSEDIIESSQEVTPNVSNSKFKRSLIRTSINIDNPSIEAKHKINISVDNIPSTVVEKTDVTPRKGRTKKRAVKSDDLVKEQEFSMQYQSEAIFDEVKQEDASINLSTSETTKPKKNKSKRGRSKKESEITDFLFQKLDTLQDVNLNESSKSEENKLRGGRHKKSLARNNDLSEEPLIISHESDVYSQKSHASTSGISDLNFNNEELTIVEVKNPEIANLTQGSPTRCPVKVEEQTVNFDDDPDIIQLAKRKQEVQNDVLLESPLLSLDISIPDVQVNTQSTDVYHEVPKKKIQGDMQPETSNIATQNIKKSTQSQDTQTQETESCDTKNHVVELQLDLPQKPILTASDIEIARMDTASLIADSDDSSDAEISSNNKTCVANTTITKAMVALTDGFVSSEKNEQNKGTVDDKEIPETETILHESPAKNREEMVCTGTPGSLEASLPSSPITGETPSRTSELLSDTLDISPIASKCSSEDDEFIERKLVPVALKFDAEEAEHEATKEKSPEKADDAPDKLDTSPEKAENDGDPEMSATSPAGSEAVIKDVKNIADRSSRFFKMVKSSSSVTNRFFNKRKSGHNMSPSASRIKKLMSNIKANTSGELADHVSREDLLTFERDVPSPLAVPRSSILKRKHSDSVEDGVSPCPKRKRVNFSDPCTTSKKVFIKDDNGQHQEQDPDEFLKQCLYSKSPESVTESDNIETEESLQMTNALLLRTDRCIYPDLVDCGDEVLIILRKVTSPMFIVMLLNKLLSKNIRTIGDLAKQSEADINRLPFKTPVVLNVFKALDNYYHKKFKSRTDMESSHSRVNDEQESVEEVAPLQKINVALVQMDVKDELTKVLERARMENVPPETLYSCIFPSPDKQQIVTYIKSYCNLQSKDILEEKEIPQVVKHITDTIGLPKTLELLAESIKSSKDESLYVDCITRNLLDKQPLGRLIEKRSLAELQEAIWDNVNNQIFHRHEVLNTCFIQHINPSDLTSFFNKLSVVQIGDIVLNRLASEDFGAFMDHVLTKFANDGFNKNEMLNNFTISELTNSVVKKSNSKELMSAITNMFLSSNADSEDTVQIFRLVTERLVGILPARKLLDLSIEFQRKIPFRD